MSNILLHTILNNDSPLFFELLKSERTSEEYNYNEYNIGNYSLSPKGNVLRMALYKSLNESDESYLNCLFEHHKHFNNINIYHHDSNGQNCLFYPTISHYYATFIELGMNSKLKNNKGHTPLLDAITYNRIIAVEKLIKAKAYSKAKDKNGASALMLAAINHNEQLLKVLLNSNQFNDLKELKKLKEKKDTHFSQDLYDLLNEKILMEGEKKRFDFIISKPQEITPKVKRKI